MPVVRVDNRRIADLAVACGVVGVAVALLMYWLVLPGILFGLAAVALAWRAGRHGHTTVSSVAMTLGVMAVLLVPAVILLTGAAEDYGRDCALEPTEDC